MKCPKCGRFSKELHVTEDGKVNIYSDCKYCGKMLVKENEEKISPRNTRYYMIVLVFVVVILIGFSWFLFDKLTEREFRSEVELFRFSELYDNYMVLVNTTSDINDYYEELQDMYMTLESEYESLSDRYVTVSNEKSNAERELNEVLNLQKSINFEDNKTIYLPAMDNITLTYDTIYAGYITVNYTSSGEIVFWFGSSVTDEKYYARYPAFPNTTKQGSIKIPVCSFTYVYIINPNNELDVTINLDIKYIY